MTNELDPKSLRIPENFLAALVQAFAEVGLPVERAQKTLLDEGESETRLCRELESLGWQYTPPVDEPEDSTEEQEFTITTVFRPFEHRRGQFTARVYKLD